MGVANAGVAGSRARLAAALTLLCVGGCALWFGLNARPAVRAYQDSAIYLEGARQLAAGQGFTTALVPLEAERPRAITAYAPGFSALMAPWVTSDRDERGAAAVVLVAAYVAYALATCALVLLAAGPGWWPAAAVLSLALILQPTVIQHVPSILSDLPFAAATTAIAGLALRWLRRDEPSLAGAAGLGVALGGATLIRWSGLHLAGVLALGLLVSLPPALPLRRRLTRAAALALGTAASVLPWLLRNRLRGGSLTGDRYLTLHDPGTIASHVVSGLASGRADLQGLLAAAPVAGHAFDGALALGLGLLLVVMWRGRAWRARAPRLLFGLALGYAAALGITAWLHIVDALVAPRYWLPVWPLLGAGAVGALAHARLSRRARLAVAAAWLLPLAAAAALFDAHRVELTRPEVELERYFLDERLASSAPVAWVRSKGRDCAVVSNYALPLTLHARPRLVRALRPDAEALRAFLASRDDVCIAYFHRREAYRAHPEADPGPVLAALAREGRIRRIQRDGFGEIWLQVPGAGR
jgi:hypothetical protein